MIKHRILKNRRPIVAASTLAAMSIAATAGAANLLLNPGFEAPPDTTQVNTNIAGWTLVNDVARASFQNHTPGGSYSVWAKTFQDIGGGVQQTVQNISANAEYNFSSFIYFEPNYPATGSTIRMRLTWLDSGGGQLSVNDLDITPASNPQLSTWDSDPLTAGDQPYNLNLMSPANAAQVRVFLGWDLGADGQAQSVFFDDVSLDGPGIPPAAFEWVPDGSGNWNVGGNWASGNVPNAAGAEVTFGAVITSARTVFTDTPVTVGVLTFNNANTYVLAGAGSLTMQQSAGNAAINVNTGTHKINLPMHLGSNTAANVGAGATLFISDPVFLNGQTLTKTGPGTMLIEAPVRATTTASRITVSNGQAQVNFPIGQAATASTNAVALTSVDVNNAAKVVFNTDQTLRALDAVTAIAGDQEVDVAGSRIRMYAANLSNEELNAYNDIRNARNSASGKDGIYSSLDDAGTSFTVGVTNQSLDARGNPSVLLRLTRTGDANVDGITNIDDFGTLAAAFNQAGRWDNGDFNYSGTVDIDDFGLLAANFNQSAAGLAGRPAAVPEPATLGLLVAGAGLIARRRR